MSTFWKDSPSSFYWDVWNSKIIKTDENGIQISSIGGYGCPCEGIITLYQNMKQKLAFYMIIKLEHLISRKMVLIKE